MPITTQVLFGTPQREIASLIRDRLHRCASASIVSGFLTLDGMNAIVAPLRTHPRKLATLVVSSSTYRGFGALDQLIAAGVPPDRLFVHLGHSAASGGRKNPFYRYHPMLHSKIYYMEMDNGTACAFVGSHNITSFALNGLNAEAAILLEGPSSDPQFTAISQHIAELQSQAAQYSLSMKQAFHWWTLESIDGLRALTNDAPRDSEPRRTIVLLAAISNGPIPRNGDIVYFEIPQELKQIASLETEIHLYVFAAVCSNPYAALDSLHAARAALYGQTFGLELGQGGQELKADWYIPGKSDPRLLPTPHPFRPNPSPGMKQVRVKVSRNLTERYEYLFDAAKERWEPVYDDNHQLQLREPDTTRDWAQPPSTSLGRSEPHPKSWHLVRTLRPAGEKQQTAYDKALFNSSPEAGSYILVSLRRRKLQDANMNKR